MARRRGCAGSVSRAKVALLSRFQLGHVRRRPAEKCVIPWRWIREREPSLEIDEGNAVTRRWWKLSAVI